jgi:hypothetical protein
MTSTLALAILIVIPSAARNPLPPVLSDVPEAAA